MPPDANGLSIVNSPNTLPAASSPSVCAPSALTGSCNKSKRASTFRYAGEASLISSPGRSDSFSLGAVMGFALVFQHLKGIGQRHQRPLDLHSYSVGGLALNVGNLAIGTTFDLHRHD